jgi:PhnB protein
MQLSLHLCFAGNCRAAFEYYARVLGGTDLSLFAYGDTPAGADVAPERRAQIVHGSITVGSMRLCGADVAPVDYATPRGFYALVGAATVAEAERVFAVLADGGEIRMPLAKTFWSPAFGVVVDRFAVRGKSAPKADGHRAASSSCTTGRRTSIRSSTYGCGQVSRVSAGSRPYFSTYARNHRRVAAFA